LTDFDAKNSDSRLFHLASTYQTTTLNQKQSRIIAFATPHHKQNLDTSSKLYIAVMPTESKTTQTSELEITGHFLDGDFSEEKHLDEINNVMGDEIKKVMDNFRYAGFFLGFVIQLVSLGAVTWIGLQSGDRTALHETVSEKVVHTLLWVLSLASLATWPVVWMTPFLLSLTDTGTPNIRFI
jgi:hypothetical protein